MICESCAGGNGVYEDEENTEEENKECSINPDGCLKEEHCPICNINKSNEIKVIV